MEQEHDVTLTDENGCCCHDDECHCHCNECHYPDNDTDDTSCDDTTPVFYKELTPDDFDDWD